MHDEVMTPAQHETLERIAGKIHGYYLGGGTALALELGHRKSLDLDFFSASLFSNDALIEVLRPDGIIFATEGTLHCTMGGVKTSFLFYRTPLVYPCIPWHGAGIADYRDIAAEKIKTVSQRGSKKDFYDIYALLRMKLDIAGLCALFRQRFAAGDVNMYHVLKSLVYFADAEADAEPVLLTGGDDWSWQSVKEFFLAAIKDFEMHLS
jgi:hypothetical protein